MFSFFSMHRQILRKFGWLAQQTRDVQDAIFSQGREQHFCAGKTVFSVGDPPGGCYAILSGQFSVTIAPNDHGPSVVHLARPGTWYGEGGFFAREPRRIGLQAVVDSTVFHLPLDAMDRLAAENPEWIRRFAQILVINLNLSLHSLDDLLIADPSRRIAAVLLRCLAENANGCLTISQSELGRLSNTSRKVVNRVLGAFATHGWLRQGYGKIELADPQALRSHMQSG